MKGCVKLSGDPDNADKIECVKCGKRCYKNDFRYTQISVPEHVAIPFNQQLTTTVLFVQFYCTNLQSSICYCQSHNIIIHKISTDWNILFPDYFEP